MTRTNSLWLIIISISALAVSLLTFSDSQSVLRPLVALWFLVVCPGEALVGLLRLGKGLTELTLAVALSLVLDAIVSEATLYFGIWSPKVSLAVLVCIAMGGVALQAGRTYWKFRTTVHQKA